MKKLVLPLALLITASLAGQSYALDEAAAKVVMAKAVDGYIRPAYKDFHEKTKALSSETAKLCAAPSEDELKQVGARFTDTIESWARVEIIREGPVLEENRFERVLFYPDRKSTGMKQVQSLVAKEDEAVTDPEALKTKSVAIQGLTAFDYVFFGAYPEGVVAEKNSFRCRYGLAIAKNVESIAGELQAAWDDPNGVQAHWKNPSKDNPVFRDGGEAIQALIGIHVHGLEMVRDQRIKPFYKGKGEKTSPKSAVFWRSGNTVSVITADIDALGTLWQVSDMGLLLPEGDGSFADSVTFDYKSARTAAAKLAAPTAEVLADKKYLAKLDFIDFTLKDAITRIDNDIGRTIGLAAGFSFADGD